MERLQASSLTLGYHREAVIDALDVHIPDGSFTAIVGPNACGKSTLLKALARLLRPRSGTVLLDGRSIHSRPTREVARQLGLLPQDPVAPDGITVGDLVARGRSPHQGMLARWSAADQAAVDQALADTGTTELVERSVDELSGGQRQRVWIALVLAQQTSLLLLDEPTTFLDIAHQVELLRLLDRLRADGRTVVAVLHELNHAARYASHLIAMTDGAIVAEGPPRQIVTAGLVREVFDLECRVIADPDDGSPVILPGPGH